MELMLSHDNPGLLCQFPAWGLLWARWYFAINGIFWFERSLPGKSILYSYAMIEEFPVG
jgi:hypothetical protein